MSNNSVPLKSGVRYKSSMFNSVLCHVYNEPDRPGITIVNTRSSAVAGRSRDASCHEIFC